MRHEESPQDHACGHTAIGRLADALVEQCRQQAPELYVSQVDGYYVRIDGVVDFLALARAAIRPELGRRLHAIKDRIDTRMNNHLCEMQEGYDAIRRREVLSWLEEHALKDHEALTLLLDVGTVLLKAKKLMERRARDGRTQP